MFHKAQQWAEPSRISTNKRRIHPMKIKNKQYKNTSEWLFLMGILMEFLICGINNKISGFGKLQRLFHIKAEKIKQCQR